MKIKNETVIIKPELKDLDGIRMLHLSDFHLTGPDQKMENYITKLKKIEVDLIFITGDAIDNDNGIGPFCKYIGMLKAKDGAWFCLGNHDEFELNLLHLFAFHKNKAKTKKNNLRKLYLELKKIGVRVLLNRTDNIRIGKSAISITGIVIPLGIDRYEPNHPNFKGELKDLERLFEMKRDQHEFSIVLSHLPDMVNLIRNFRAELCLSGHTHGGQVRIPFIGPLYAFSKFQRKHSMGLFKLPNGSYLNVSAGLGQSKETPIRAFCPAEATVITLRCSKEST